MSSLSDALDAYRNSETAHERIYKSFQRVAVDFARMRIRQSNVRILESGSHIAATALQQSLEAVARGNTRGPVDSQDFKNLLFEVIRRRILDAARLEGAEKRPNTVNTVDTLVSEERACDDPVVQVQIAEVAESATAALLSRYLGKPNEAIQIMVASLAVCQNMTAKNIHQVLEAQLGEANTPSLHVIRRQVTADRAFFQEEVRKGLGDDG